jgi:hypothetical protein
MRQVTGEALWLGNAGDSRDLEMMLAAGIRALVDLAEEEPIPALTRDLIYCRFPLIDGTGNPPWLLQAAVETTARLVRWRVPALVCCGAGMSRTPCIAGAALSVVRGVVLDEGLATAAHTGASDVSPALWMDVRNAVSRLQEGSA